MEKKPEAMHKIKPIGWGPVEVAILTVIIFFGTQFLVSLLVGGALLASGWSEGQINSWLSSSAFPQFLFVVLVDALVLLSVVGLLRNKRKTLKDIGLEKPVLQDVSQALLGYGAYFLLLIIVTGVAKVVVPSLNFEQEQQTGFEAAKSGLDLILTGVSLVLLPPIIEEILCRGFLYSGLRNKLKFWPAAILTSAIFAVAHLQFGSGAPLLWVAAIDTFVLSMVLVRLRENTGRLFAPMLVHMIKNGLAFTILFVFK